jgi:protein phosphatase
MQISIPDLSLIVLIGASGSGKSSFARKHFLPTEIISSDYCRSILADDENDQSVSGEAFELLHYIVAKRLKAGRLTVVDATNVKPEDRKPLLQIAKDYHCFAVAIAFDLPAQLCHDRNQKRGNRNFGIHVVERHRQNLRKSLRFLDKEFRFAHVLNSVEKIDRVEFVRTPSWSNRKTETGPFDIIGDIHGCCDELEILLGKLGYQATPATETGFWDFPIYSHPEGRRVLFVGDLVDRGIRNMDTVKLVRNMIEANSALCVCGNHEFKLMRYLRGKKVTVSHGLQQTIDELDSIPTEVSEDYKIDLQKFLDSLISHYVLDEGKLVVAHAGLKEELQGRTSGFVRSFAMYGETTGEIDEYGLPVRANWAQNYRGKATVVYGHVPVREAEWLNNSIDIDTGCVFGGKLTALRYPERELVQVPAARVYFEPIKPLGGDEPKLTAQQENDDLLNIMDVTGKRFLETRLHSKITIHADRSIAALEVMSRFAVNPKWLIYLPPTMSPVATSNQGSYLEYPTEAFDYYRQHNITQVVCEEKHMGSRAIVVIGKNEAAIERHFGIVNEGIGVCYTRTGRRFFTEPQLETEFLTKLNAALSNSGFWQKLDTEWVCLDCELMPWSAKAQGLLRGQYAAVGAAATHGLDYATQLLQQASDRGITVTEQLAKTMARSTLAHKYVDAYRRYCWNVNSIADFKLAPFHIMATDGAVHINKDHRWHMDRISEICGADPSLLLATNHRVVDLQDAAAVAAATQWWESLTASGGEGMVVKSLNFVERGEKGLIQPAVKCRGSEYLRIIYGPEYDLPEYLDRLRQRGLGAKRALALREFALGIEALERFVTHQPLRQIHECVFGVLALESEPIDPRL